MARRTWIWLAVLLPLVTACATMLPGMEAPQLSIINIEPLQAEGPFEQRARVDLRIINPNDTALAINGMSFQLDINDTPFARGVSNQAVSVPRLGEAKTSVIVSTSVLDVFRQLVTLGGAQHDRLNYTIKGKLYLAGSGIGGVSFSHSGELGAERP